MSSNSQKPTLTNMLDFENIGDQNRAFHTIFINEFNFSRPFSKKNISVRQKSQTPRNFQVAGHNRQLWSFQTTLLVCLCCQLRGLLRNNVVKNHRQQKCSYKKGEDKKSPLTREGRKKSDHL